MKKLVPVISILLLLITSVSCKDDKKDKDIVGDWPAMKWELKNTVGNIEMEIVTGGITNFFVDVNETGSFDVECTNYGGFWFAAGANDADLLYKYNNEWLELTIEENVLHCKVLEMMSFYKEEIYIEITAGDVFNSFYFVRNPDNKKDPEIDGAWEAMEWKSVQKDGEIEVDFVSDALAYIYVDGTGYIDIECTNYSSFWFSYGNYYPEKPDSLSEYDEDWVELEIEGNVIHCNFIDFEPGFSEEIIVGITAGDIFYNFCFVKKDK